MTRSVPLGRIALCALALLLMATFAFAQQIPNWAVPNHLRIGANNDISAQQPFIAVTPCRVVDTRNATGPFGGPAMTPGGTRSFTIPAGPCTNIPAAPAYSLQFTIVNYDAGGGFITAWPAGSAQPGVSTLNYGPNPAYGVANAAIVPANGSGAISVFSSGNTQLIIDINGYYSSGSIGGPLSSVYSHLWLYTSTGNETLFAWNEGVGSFSPSLRGYMTDTTNGRAAVMGDSTGATGSTDAIRGTNASTTDGSAGVHGVSGSDMPTDRQAAGVRGASATRVGVVGQSQYLAISGVLYNASNLFVAEGDIGYNGFALYGFGNFGVTGTKAFIDPDPRDASKSIRYVALEGNEAGTYFRGKGKFVNGQAVIDVPQSFRDVTEEDGLTVNVTPMGRIASVGVISADLSSIVVESTRDVDFSYIVYGVRRGYKDYQVVVEGADFMPRSSDEKMPEYLNASQKERLIANGTYNSDGTVNMATAVRLGWTKVWADRAAEAAASAATTKFAPVPHE